MTRRQEAPVIDVPSRGLKVGVSEHVTDLLGQPTTKVRGHGGVSTGVAEQPSGIEEGFRGATNRGINLEKALAREMVDWTKMLLTESFVHASAIAAPPREWNGAAVHDIAAVVSRDAEAGYGHLFTSAGIRFPQEYYLIAQRKWLGLHTVGEAFEEDFKGWRRFLKRRGSGYDPKDPHSYLTSGEYNRGDLLTIPTYLALMTDVGQGRKLEEYIRDRIGSSNVRMPEDTRRTLITSDQRLKVDAYEQVLSNLGIFQPEVESYDCNSPEAPEQITDLNTCFSEAFKRIEILDKEKVAPRPGDLTLSMQSCLVPVILNQPHPQAPELRFIDLGVVIARKIDNKGKRRYYTSVTAGTEFPKDKVLLVATSEGFNLKTVGSEIAGPEGDPADPQKNLYGVSRKLLLEEAVFAAFAQMKSGLEVK